MNKYLLIISLALISLLAIGAVSAADASNITDDSAVAMPSEDISEGVVVDGGDNLEATSQEGKLEKVDEEAMDSNDANNQSTEILSDANDNNNKPTVTVDDVTFESGDTIAVPFHVADSGGQPISGWAIVTLYSENNSLAKYVKVNNGSGQVNYTITELLGITPKSDASIYDVLISSISTTNVNSSQIIDGFKDICAGFSINFSDIYDGLKEILDGNYINISQINEGLDLIKDSFTINISSIKEGFNDILNGININISNIIHDLIINITDSVNLTKFNDALNVIISEVSLEISNLLDNVSQGVTFNKTVFDDLLDDIYKELDINSTVLLSKIDDLMTYLNFTSELKDNINNILNGSDSNLTNIILAVNGILDANLTISNVTLALINVTGGFSNFSSIVTKIKNFNFTDALNKIIDSVIDYNKLSDALSNFTINSTKIIDELENISGINISNICDGIIDMFNGIMFNQSTNFTSGIMDIFDGIGLLLSDASEIYNATKLGFSDIFEDIINGLDISKGDIFVKVVDLIDYLELTFPDKFSDVLVGIVLGNNLNFIDLVDGVKQFIGNNTNLTFKKVLDGLDNVTDGYLFNISKIIDKLSSPELNVTNNWNKMLDSFDLNYTEAISKFVDAFKKIYGIDFNTSAIENGFDKINHEIDLNVTAFMAALIDSIAKEINIDNATISEGFNKILDSFDFNVSDFDDGVKKVVDAFNFNITSIFNGLNKAIDAFSYNSTAIKDGINKIENAIDINIANIADQILNKFGSGYVLSYFLIPDSYVFSFDLKMPTQIVASQVSTTYGNSKNMVVTLKDFSGNLIAGKDISVKLNGKTYNGVTNAKGQVSIKVPKNLAPKTYNAVVTFKGDKTLGKTTKSVKVVVSKLTPKMTAKKKTFKKSVKTKKYTITLKTNKNKVMKKKKVTLKVNGKTYKAKTNSKGKATFKITKLTKKGTYKAVVKFNGDKYYKKVTKKPKITIK